MEINPTLTIGLIASKGGAEAKLRKMLVANLFFAAGLCIVFGGLIYIVFATNFMRPLTDSISYVCFGVFAILSIYLFVQFCRSLAINSYCIHLVNTGRGDEVREWSKDEKEVEGFLALRLGTCEEVLQCTREVLQDRDELKLRKMLESNFFWALGLQGCTLFLISLLFSREFVGPPTGIFSGLVAIVSIGGFVNFSLSMIINWYCGYLVVGGRGDEVREWSKKKQVEYFLNLRFSCSSEELLQCTREVLQGMEREEDSIV